MWTKINKVTSLRYTVWSCFQEPGKQTVHLKQFSCQARWVDSARERFLFDKALKISGRNFFLRIGFNALSTS